MAKFLQLALFFSCDADPSALAKYVLALVKKDKSEKELKALCIDQLDVFLQKGKIFCFMILLCLLKITHRVFKDLNKIQVLTVSKLNKEYDD